MSIKMFQGLIGQIKEIVSCETGILDENGTIIACSDENRIGTSFPEFVAVTDDREDFIVSGSYMLHKVSIRNRLEYIVYIESTGTDSQKLLSLIALNLVNIKAFYDEKYDRNSFIKDILTENIFAGDISIKAKDLHISRDASRVAILIKSERSKDVYIYDIIQGMFPNKARDFVVVLDDENIVLIKELRANEGIREVEKTARVIVDTMLAESMLKTVAAVGTIVDSLADVKRSLKEAQIALSIGDIFENEWSVASYSNLGIGRLIYQLPEEVCRLFLDEVFRDSPLELLDPEILFTIQKFFENNLNVSETSRQLYVHRNTLVYRLDKIQKVTGLDLRRFDDAIVFKFAMLVKRYIESGRKL